MVQNMKPEKDFLSVYIEPDTKEMLKLYAKQEGRSASAQAERIIRTHLWNLQVKGKKCPR
jgi:hypothetical protein